MGEPSKLLPGTGRWQRVALTVGAPGAVLALLAPSTMLRMVPLPVPGRN